MAMDKFKKYQVLILIILAFLLLITHFLPSFMRSPFLYFIFNLLIISLGAEAGFLSSSSSSSASSISPLHHDKKTSSSSSSLMISQKPAVILAHAEAISEVKEKAYSIPSSEPIEKKVILVTVTKPSLFFIACEETEDAEEAMNNKVGEEEEESNEEEVLCAKAEAFIGNFYKQLKIQREESWKKIHYHIAF